eukprot:7799299-Pyramimonas_sp.AAC.1
MADGTLMSSVLVNPPGPRCITAACWGGDIFPLATLGHACTSRTKSRKGALPEEPQKGPRVRVSSSPPSRMYATARPRHTQIVPKIATFK